MGFFGQTSSAVAEDWWEDGNPYIENIQESLTVTASSTIHTKGAWTQAIASTSADCSLLIVSVTAVAAANTQTSMLLDIGTGASGSETAIVQNVAVSGADGANFNGAVGITYCVPYKIPSGTRISARIQSLISSDTALVRIAVCSAGDYETAPTSVDAIGTDTSTSQGTALTGVTTYAQLIASTTRAYRALVVIPSLSNSNTASSVNEVMTVAVGAAGSEVDFAKVYYRRTSGESMLELLPLVSLFARSIPAGSRLSVKGSASGNGVECTVIGVP